MDIVEYIFEISKEMQSKEKTLKDIAIKLGEESGEVMGVISTITRDSYKQINKDTLSKELADVLTNIVDLGYIYYGDDFLEIFQKSVKEKCLKWKENYKI